MTGLALALVLVSAVCHAVWNLLAKRTPGGLALTWLFGMVSTAAYAPLLALLALVQRPHVGRIQLAFIIGSSLLHLLYFTLLTRGYAVGDLSLVYPLARGTGPLLSTIAAIIVFGERPTLLALTGAMLVVSGVVVLAGDPRALYRSDAAQSVIYALLTGVVIAGYTLWDKEAVSGLGIPPLLYSWSFFGGLALLITPYAALHQHEVARQWRCYWREVVGIALLAPLAYMLVLAALVAAPVSYVAPARETGILVGTLLGSQFLAEGQARRRLCGAALMVLGVMGLALG